MELREFSGSWTNEIIGFKSWILGPQFDSLLRAEVLPYFMDTTTEMDQVLLKIDPLAVQPSWPEPKFTLDAGEIDIFE